MKKTFILAPDSFKGTLSAPEVCRIQQEVIHSVSPESEVMSLYMADGGEGMVQAFRKILGGKIVAVPVSDPLGGTVEAEYLMLEDNTAVIEMSAAAGLPLVLGRENPMDTTTFGVGELILHAAAQGAKKILLGLGGSSTNDCGIGMASALGFRFLDKDGSDVEPLARNLGLIDRIVPPVQFSLPPVLAACDVNNPLLGPTGATYTFAPQKGATAEMLERLENGMTRFSAVLAAFCGSGALADIPGTGAAGGMGAACIGFLKGRLVPGAELLLDAAGFDTLLGKADYVITGEGRIDWQSANGKVVGTVAQHCKKAHVPCIALCGSIGKQSEQLYDCGVSAIFSATQGPCSFEEIMKTAPKDLEQVTRAVIRTLFIDQL